jgi:3D (Asp-Asp-Asp) domain-containing protein
MKMDTGNRIEIRRRKRVLKRYFKRCGILSAVLAFLCTLTFVMAATPAGAAAYSGDVEFTQKYLGGAHTGLSEIKVARNTAGGDGRDADAGEPANNAVEGRRYVGNFKITHYCSCTICTWGTGITASGKPVAEGMIATDWSVLPQGATVYIEHGGAALEKVVEDKGGAIQGNRIDVYVSSHEEALQLGVYWADVYVGS